MIFSVHKRNQNMHPPPPKYILFCSQGYLVDQLLIQKIEWTEGWGKYQNRPWTSIVSELTRYADGMVDEDETWKPDDKDGMLMHCVM